MPQNRRGCMRHATLLFPHRGWQYKAMCAGGEGWMMNHGHTPAYAEASAGRRTGRSNTRPGNLKTAERKRGMSVLVSGFINHGLHRLGSLTFAVMWIGAVVAADPAITVLAKQRYPWNGLVDLQFTITGTSGTKYDTSFTAKDVIGDTNITMRTIRKLDGTAANVAKEQLLPGNYKWVWDAAADLPDGFECDRVTVTGTAEEWKPLYMVVDLSTGPDSSSYPVSYLDAVPTGGWSDEYKTTKLVLRRIEPGSFLMCGEYRVTLTKPFYIGVFEVTQKQYELVTGRRPSAFSNAAYYETRPVEKLFYNDIRGSSEWPESSVVSSTSFMGKIRAKTALEDFDLPTEAQWEYACRANSATDYNNGANMTDGEQDSAMAGVGRYWYNGGSQASSYTQYSTCSPTQGTATVGSYVPNAWGLYDMHGNVFEWCLDRFGDLENDVVDPKGLGLNDFRRVLRGGGWRSKACECISSYRISDEASYVIYHNASRPDAGFRLCVPLHQ